MKIFATRNVEEPNANLLLAELQTCVRKACRGAAGWPGQNAEGRSAFQPEATPFHCVPYDSIQLN
jgi:hypothetical protein